MDWKDSLNRQEHVISLVLADKEVVSKIDALVKHLQNRQVVFFTGIGKNGFIAEKVASTFNSLGIRSIFLNPVDTLHGEMGVFIEGSTLIALSKSGETEELIAFVEALNKNNFRPNLVLITSSKSSKLGALASEVICIPVPEEGDQLNMAPIASTLTYMAVLQAIGVEISSNKGFTKKEFVRLHPGGALGKTKV